MRTQYDEVFTAGPCVLFSTSTKLHDLADLSVMDHVTDAVDGLGSTGLMPGHNFNASPGGQRYHLVGNWKAGRKGSFNNSIRANLDSRTEHRKALIRPPATDADNVRPFPLKHLPIIRVGTKRPAALLGFGPAGVIRI
jgi:hypothetical protein